MDQLPRGMGLREVDVSQFRVHVPEKYLRLVCEVVEQSGIGI
jgi:hypothetical protein